MNFIETPYTLFITALSIGFLGSTHCVAMCGGIASALNVSSENTAPGNSLSLYKRHTLFSIGRITSYLIAGGLCGSIGVGLETLMPSWVLPFSRALLAIMLILIGLYLTQWWPILVRLEQLGGPFWQRIYQRLSYLLPIDHWTKAITVGALWGWIPCGLVYSALIISISTRSSQLGMLFMLGFGLGTLPAVLGVCLLSKKINMIRTKRYAGILLLCFGISSLLFQLHHYRQHGSDHALHSSSSSEMSEHHIHHQLPD